jgi:hypothetical protein
MPVNKADVVRLIEAFSQGDEVDTDRLIYTLALRHAKEQGLMEPDASEEATPEEIERVLRHYGVSGEFDFSKRRADA